MSARRPINPAKHLRVGLLHGDGIGPDIVDATAWVTEAVIKTHTTVDLAWQVLPIGRYAISSKGRPLPEDTLSALEELDAWILGPHDNASYPDRWRGQLSPGGAIRKHFDLFANIRPARAFSSTAPVSPQMDLVVVRENTEGFYADRNMHRGSGEFMPTPDMAMAVGVVTRKACERIAHQAFQLAQQRRRHVTIAHKTNVLTMTTGLFRDVCTEIGATHYPHITVDEQHIDALAAGLVRKGNWYDVIVAENMFGDILSDLAGELAGSIGIAPSLNSSDTKAMAQATHGAAPDIAHLKTANPTAMILSGSMLLRWLAERRDLPELIVAAQTIETAVESAISAGIRTPDLGGTATTMKFAAAVVDLASTDAIASPVEFAIHYTTDKGNIR